MANKRKDTTLIDYISQEIYDVIKDYTKDSTMLPYISLSDLQKSKYEAYAKQILNVINKTFMMERSKASLVKKISTISGVGQKDVMDIFHSLITMIYINKINNEKIETPYDVLLELESDSLKEVITKLLQNYGLY